MPLPRAAALLAAAAVCAVPAVPAVLFAQTAGTAQTAAPRQAPADFILGALARHPIVFVGDVHPLAEPKTIIAEVVRRQDPERPIDALALEVASEQQEYIDAYLASMPEDTTILLEHPRTLRAHWGASAEYLAIYRTVYRWNREHPARPIRILAADLRGWPIAPLTTMMAAGGFANRDAWMADRFRRVMKEHPEWRVLVFMGGYHGMRTGGGEVRVGRSREEFERWFAGWLGASGLPVYTVMTDAQLPSGHGATRLYDRLAAERPAQNFAVALDESTDAVTEPLHAIELDGYSLEFRPARFRLRDAIDGMIVLTRATPISVLEAFRPRAPSDSTRSP